MAIGIVPELDAPEATREAVGKAYATYIRDARSDRDTRMRDVWALALKNYEGKAEVRNWPWKNASNAVISLTPAHTDAWEARIRNAGTASDPVYLTSAWGPGEIIPGVTAAEYAELYQEFSKWIEKEEVPNDAWMEKVSTVLTKYGNAIVYIPFEHDYVMDVTFDREGNAVKEKLDLLNKPVIHVIHPKNFYMPVTEEDPQLSPWCGFDVLISPDQARLKIATGEWNKKHGEALLKFMKEKTAKERKADGGPKNEGYYKRTEDGREMPRSEWDKEQARSISMPNKSDSDRIPLVRIFARIDTDGDQYPEEVELLLHVDSGIIPQWHWQRYSHKKRPLVLFSFKWREGTWLAMGVPEMLFNSQRIMNEIVRDMLDNNKIRNTKIFLARAGGVIGADEPVFPSRVILMEDVERDFKAMDLGSGVPSTGLQDLSIIQAWAERRDGMTDFNLGREKTSRTPASTLQALLDEGNERVVAIIRRMRIAQTEVWTQVHQLYAQNGDAEGLDRVLGPEKATKIRDVWASMDVTDIRKKLTLNAQVSTQNLNRAVKRQENVALMGQLDMFHQRAIAIAQIVSGTADPVLRALAITMLKSGQFLMTRILNSYDIKDHADMNPDLASAVAQLPPSPVPVPGLEPGAAPGGQVGQAVKQGPEGGPLNVPGRPAAGMPRADGMGG